MQAIRGGVASLAQIASWAVILLAGAYILYVDRNTTLDAARQQVVDDSTQVATALVSGFAVREVMAHAIAAASTTAPTLDQAEFSRLAAFISGDYDDLVNIAYAPDLVVRYVHPFEENQSVLGLDYRVPSSFTAGVETALASKRAVLVGPIEIIQGGQAFVLRVPVKSGQEASPDDLGIVTLVISLEAFRAATGLDQAIQGLDFIAYHGSPDETTIGLSFGTTSTCDPTAIRKQLTVVGDTWTLCLIPEDGWPVWGNNAWPIILITLVVAAVSSGLIQLINRFRMKEAIAKRQLWDAIESLHDGFAFYDADDRLVLCNSKYREIYKASEGALQPGRTFREIIEEGLRNGQYPEALGREKEFLEERMQAHRNPQSNIEQKLPDGRWLQISERKTSDGGTVGFRVDVTELKSAKEAAEASNIAMTEFLNNINHEIRTPLSVIIGYIRFLATPEVLRSYEKLSQVRNNPTIPSEELQDAVDAFVDEVSSHAKRIQKSSDHLMALVQDTLDLSKAQSGDLSFNPSRVDLGQIVEDCAQHFSNQAAEKNLELRTEIQKMDIWADPTRMRQILINVIGNAVKFTSEGSVLVTSEKEGDWAVIRVQDTGPGIAPEYRERIFDKFWQADSSVTRGYGGTGLGLTITRKLVELHGGEVALDDRIEDGTHIVIKVPLDRNRAKHLTLVPERLAG